MRFVRVQPEYARTDVGSGSERDFVRVGPESAHAETAANLCRNLWRPISLCETGAPQYAAAARLAV